MGRLTILAFSVAILFSCTTEADQAQGIEKKEIRQSQLVTQKKGGIEETKTPKRASDSLKEIISDVAMSLHNWCIPIVKDMNSSTNIAAEVVEGENGYCRLDYSGYFNELRKLNTISEDFLIAEKERTSACAAFISTITWDEYMNGEAYQYGEECPEFYF
ncbi:MAG: hypothetical protein NXI10_16320, partial [bacterium]|nr:hypothetical protein [bacterium]